MATYCHNGDVAIAVIIFPLSTYTPRVSHEHPALWAQKMHWNLHPKSKSSHLGWLFGVVLLGAWASEPWWYIEAGTQAKNQIPHLSKAEVSGCSDVRPRPLTAYPPWNRVPAALASSASLSACWTLCEVPVTHSESWHTDSLSSLPTSVVVSRIRSQSCQILLRISCDISPGTNGQGPIISQTTSGVHRSPHFISEFAMNSSFKTATHEE